MTNRAAIRDTNERIVRRTTGVSRTPVTTVDRGRANGTTVVGDASLPVFPGGDGINTFILDEDSLDTDDVVID